MKFEKQIMLGAVYILMNNCEKYMYCKGCPLLDKKSGGFYHGINEAWWQDSGLLSELITGEAVIYD